MAFKFTSPQGVVMTETKQYTATFSVHPKHVPFIIGKKGVTIKNLSKRSRSFIKIQNPPKQKNNEFPWFVITANNIRAVEEGIRLVRETAIKAEEKMPTSRNNRPPPLDFSHNSDGGSLNDSFTPHTPIESPTYLPSSPTFNFVGQIDETANKSKEAKKETEKN